MKSLTKEQLDMVPVYAKRYTDKFYNSPEAVFERVESFVHWVYEQFSDRPKPKVFLCDSPIECLREHAKFYGLSKVEWVAPSNYVSAFNSWVSYYAFIDEQVQPLNNPIFKRYQEVLDLGIFWSLLTDDAAFVCRNAKYTLNDRNLLHNVEGPAVSFPNRSSDFYFINGVNISTELFKKLESKAYTAEDFSREPNEETKNLIMIFMKERWGETYFVDFIRSFLREVDTYVHNTGEEFKVGTTGGMNIGVYTLFSGQVNDQEVNYVRCYCPSTDRMFFLGVEPGHKKAKDAIASLYRVPAVLKDHIKEIRRQGERYSTTFTDKGKKILKDLSKEQALKTVPVTGDTYFSLLTYEY